jgi:hypothetical protein
MTLPFLSFAAGQFAFHGLPQKLRHWLCFIQDRVDSLPRSLREARGDLFAWFVDSLSAHAGDN